MPIRLTCPQDFGPFKKRVCSHNVQCNEENEEYGSHSLATLRGPWPWWGRVSPYKQIVGILQEYAAGAKVSELRRKHGMSDATLYKWKAKYGSMTVSELRRLKDLKVENSELKRLLADAMLDNAGLKGLLVKNS